LGAIKKPLKLVVFEYIAKVRSVLTPFALDYIFWVIGGDAGEK